MSVIFPPAPSYIQKLWRGEIRAYKNYGVQKSEHTKSMVCRNQSIQTWWSGETTTYKNYGVERSELTKLWSRAISRNRPEHNQSTTIAQPIAQPIAQLLSLQQGCVRAMRRKKKYIVISLSCKTSRKYVFSLRIWVVLWVAIGYPAGRTQMRL